MKTAILFLTLTLTPAAHAFEQPSRETLYQYCLSGEAQLKESKGKKSISICNLIPGSEGIRACEDGLAGRDCDALYK